MTSSTDPNKSKTFDHFVFAIISIAIILITDGDSYPKVVLALSILFFFLYRMSPGNRGEYFATASRVVAASFIITTAFAVLTVFGIAYILAYYIGLFVHQIPGVIGGMALGMLYDFVFASRLSEKTGFGVHCGAVVAVLALTFA